MIDADVRLAARALARHGLAHAYGHVSARVDSERFVVTPARPLGCVRHDITLVTVPIEGPLPQGALPEVVLHQAIYRSQADVGGICRFQSPSVLALSALRRTPRALHGLGAYFAPAPPLWDDPSLVRDVERASAAAAKMGSARALVLRGNGAVTVGTSVRRAAAHAFCLEDAARLELAVLATGLPATEYTDDEALRRSAPDESLYARLWEYLVDRDLEEVQS